MKDNQIWWWDYCNQCGRRYQIIPFVYEDLICPGCREKERNVECSCGKRFYHTAGKIPDPCPHCGGGPYVPRQEHEENLKKPAEVPVYIEKPPWDLLPFSALEEVVKVLGFGAEKYSSYGWQNAVKEDPDAFLAKALRHITSWSESDVGEDSESGLSNLAHAIANLLFLLWIEKEVE